MLECLKVGTVNYSHWEKVNAKTTSRSKSDKTITFVTSFITDVSKLALHDFNACMKISATRQFKSELKEGEVLVCRDFAKNFTYIVQNSTQGQHWNNSQATIHPIVCYYRSENELKHFSYVRISDKMEHDTMAARTFMKHLIDFLKMKLGSIKKMIYFTDGCRTQYKNKDNFFNLCLHEDDFVIEAEWHFFATSHGR